MMSFSSFTSQLQSVLNTVSESFDSGKADYLRERQAKDGARFTEEAPLMMDWTVSGQETVLPWGTDMELKDKILGLSAQVRNLTSEPPSGTDFVFDLKSSIPTALALLKMDSRLRNHRFELVPKVLKDEHFWRNYFYRIHVVKQQSRLAHPPVLDDIAKNVTVPDENVLFEASEMGEMGEMDEPQYGSDWEKELQAELDTDLDL